MANKHQQLNNNELYIETKNTSLKAHNFRGKNSGNNTPEPAQKVSRNRNGSLDACKQKEQNCAEPQAQKKNYEMPLLRKNKIRWMHYGGRTINFE